MNAPNEKPAMPSLCWHRSTFRSPSAGWLGRRGFTLLEILVATTIFGLAIGITLTAFVAALKQSKHAELAIEGAAELRHATDIISQAVRSAPQAPTVQSGGLELLVAPKDLGYATVLATTWIDMVNGVKGSKSNQRMLHVSNYAASAVSTSIFASAARPSGALTSSAVSTYFTDATDLPSIDLNEIFASGDTLTIPATSYGSLVTGVINNISNNSGNKTLTLTNNLGVDVPNGTRIAATSGRRHLFSVQGNGDLRYYPDHRDLTVFTILAQDIDPSPLTDPADPDSDVTVPFKVEERFVTLNLQQLPRGSIAGRTVQGATTTVYARTDPVIP